MRCSNGYPLRSRAPLAILFIAAGALSAADVTYQVVPEKSSITFELPATGHTVHGKTQSIKGTYLFPEKLEAKAQDVRARIEIQAATLDTENKRRDKKMHEETLSVDRFPLIVFELQRVEGEIQKIPQGQPVALLLIGKLTIRDMSREVSISSKVTLKNGALLVEGTYPLQFTDYNVPDPSILLLRVKKDISVGFSVVCVPVKNPIGK